MAPGGQPPPHGERASVSEGLTERDEFKIISRGKPERNRPSREQKN